jgi:hypothetical protein
LNRIASSRCAWELEESFAQDVNLPRVPNCPSRATDN